MTVDYRILSWGHYYPGGATWTVDFEGRNHGTLTFYEGERLQQIEITVIEDRQEEGTEDFHVSLHNPQGGTRIADYLAEGTIMD